MSIYISFVTRLVESVPDLCSFIGRISIAVYLDRSQLVIIPIDGDRHHELLVVVNII
jgi:hypothetical protein